MQIANTDGYVVLDEGDLDGRLHGEVVPPDASRYGWRWWVKLIALCILASVLAVILLKWIGPLIIEKVIINNNNSNFIFLIINVRTMEEFIGVSLIPRPSKISVFPNPV